MASQKSPNVKSHKAVGVQKTPAGWVACEYVIQGDKVVEVVSSEPNNRMVALGYLKKLMRRVWMDGV